MNIVLFDNFFEENFNPNQVRNFGLSQLVNKDLINDAIPCYPGIRTPPINIINPNLTEYIRAKILPPTIQLCESEKIKPKEKYLLKMFYHLTSSVHCCGVIHQDTCDFASVIYLNPNPPKNSGTLLHVLKKNFSREQIMQEHKNTANYFVESCTSKESEVIYLSKKKLIERDKKYFDLEYTIPNTYNSAVLYPAKYWHSPDQYFGEGLEDSRLSIAVFLTFID